MKKFFSMVLCAMLLAGGAMAQNAVSSNLASVRLDYTKTTDAVAKAIKTVVIPRNEAGVIRIQIVGATVDSIAACTGVISYRYTKVAGVLTLGTVVANEAIVADTRVSGATFSAAAVSNNIVISVTGKAAQTMYWQAYVSRRAIVKIE